VLSVIGGWFITAGAAFTIAFLAALLISWGGIPAMAVMVALAAYSLVRSQITYRKKLKKDALKEEINSTVAELSATTNPREALNLFRKHSREEIQSTLLFSADSLDLAVNSIISGNLKDLRKVLNNIEEKRILLKQIKRVGTLGVTQIEQDIAVDKGLYYYQSNDFASEIIYSIRRFTEPGRDHIDNSFNPVSEEQVRDLKSILPEIVTYLHNGAVMVQKNNYTQLTNLISESISLNSKLLILKRAELKRVQKDSDASTKTSMLYLTMVYEIQNVVNFAANLLKVSRKFQME
jgi:phosphate/sulfate permease